MFLSELPGYTRAAERAGRLEDAWRDYAFLGLGEKICGVEVNLLTLRMFIELCVVRSPFFVGGNVGPEDVALVLWRLSPCYSRANSSSSSSSCSFPSSPPKDKGSRTRDEDEDEHEKKNPRRAFVASIAHLPFERAVRAISRYLDRMLIDKPVSTENGNFAAPDTSFAAGIIHALASEYGWSQDDVLDVPMPRLFQYLRLIQREHNPKLARFNPIRARLTKKIIARALDPKSCSSSSSSSTPPNEKRPRTRDEDEDEHEKIAQP